MKTKLMIMSVLTAACIFVFSGAAWADGKKDRHQKNPKQKLYTVSKHLKPAVHQQNQWQQASRYQDQKQRYQKRFHQRSKYHHPLSHNRNYRYKPYYKHHDNFGRYYKPRHYIQRPIYSNPHGKVSIMTSTSHHGWSIKVSSRD